MRNRTSIASVYLLAWISTAGLTACGRATGSATSADEPSKDVPAVAALPSVAKSSLTVSIPRVADGVTPADVVVLLRTANNDPVPGITPFLTVSGSGNTITACTLTNSSGISNCSVTSTVAELKTFVVRAQIALTASIRFEPPPRPLVGMGFSSGGGISQASDSSYSIRGSIGVPESVREMKDSSNNVRARLSLQSGVD